MYIKKSCIYQHTLVQDNELLRFQREFDIHLKVKNQIKTMLATILNTYCINSL